ncbi:hypothetical protein MPH_06808 [Macrophomina phaseolina MS6]|uniref:Rhodopsin domain-containing protein n=1 Tax=Macrophomina phaseolina (strain MS6) TaxID=1126212 RepID=K2RTG7_MACPH|nr:hypothetical protein MPH_06808 [Macrophomina phaseolina MS6]
MSELATGAQSVLVCSIACTVVVVVVTAVRLYTRIILVAGLGSDDYALLAAITTFFAMMSLFLVGLKYGLGKHLADVNPRKQDMFMKLMIGAGTLYNTVMLACKLSILLLYRRLFPLQSFNKRWWYINQTGDKCPSKWAFYVANSAFNLISDILILILPIPVIKSLSLELRQKITLYILFALGSATVVVSAVRLQSIILFLKTDDGDITFRTSKLAIWCLVETTISIVCVCAPTLRPFFRRYFGAFFSWSGSGSNSNGNLNQSRYFSSLFRSSRYGRQSSRNEDVPDLPIHNLSAHHRTMIANETLELGSPQKTEARVEVLAGAHVVDIGAGPGVGLGTPPEYDDARSTDHIIDEHKSGVLGAVSARDSEDSGRSSSVS